MNGDVRAEHARLSALVVLRLDELRAALERREAERRWDVDLLARVEAGLARLAAEVAGQ